MEDYTSVRKTRGKKNTGQPESVNKPHNLFDIDDSFGSSRKNDLDQFINRDRSRMFDEEYCDTSDPLSRKKQLEHNNITADVKGSGPKPKRKKADSVTSYINSANSGSTASDSTDPKRFVYFIRQMDGKKSHDIFIKVGITNNVKKYRETIEEGSPFKLKTEKVIATPDESHANNVLSDFAAVHKHNANSWFKISRATLADFLQKYNTFPYELLSESSARNKKPRSTKKIVSMMEKLEISDDE